MGAMLDNVEIEGISLGDNVLFDMNEFYDSSLLICQYGPAGLTLMNYDSTRNIGKFLEVGNANTLANFESKDVELLKLPAGFVFSSDNPSIISFDSGEITGTHKATYTEGTLVCNLGNPSSSPTNKGIKKAGIMIEGKYILGYEFNVEKI